MRLIVVLGLMKNKEKHTLISVIAKKDLNLINFVRFRQKFDAKMQEGEKRGKKK